MMNSANRATFAPIEYFSDYPYDQDTFWYIKIKGAELFNFANTLALSFAGIATSAAIFTI